MIIWGIDFAKNKQPKPDHGEARVFRLVCGGRQVVEQDTAPSELWPCEDYVAPDRDGA